MSTFITGYLANYKQWLDLVARSRLRAGRAVDPNRF